MSAFGGKADMAIAVRNVCKVPHKIILPTEIIDKTNYKAWLIPVAERPCPTWDEVVR
jgi:ribose transport system substrate-binding protein